MIARTWKSWKLFYYCALRIFATSTVEDLIKRLANGTVDLFDFELTAFEKSVMRALERVCVVERSYRHRAGDEVQIYWVLQPSAASEWLDTPGVSPPGADPMHGAIGRALGSVGNPGLVP